MLYLCTATYTAPERRFGQVKGTLTFHYKLADGSRQMTQIEHNNVSYDQLQAACARLYSALLVDYS